MRGLGRPAIQIYCDGSAHERRGLPGGWAFAVVQSDRLLFSGSGAVPATTNNEVELRAAIAGVRAVTSRGMHGGRCEVELISDSRITLDVAQGVAPPAAHAMLGAELRSVAVETGLKATWVRGHSGNRWNEYVDRMAHEAKLTLVPLRKQSRR